MSYCQRLDDGSLLISLRVIPRASRTGFAGVRNDELVLRLNAPPVDGKANEAVCKFIAGQFACKRSAISIVSGQLARTKRLRIDPPWSWPADLDET